MRVVNRGVCFTFGLWLLAFGLPAAQQPAPPPPFRAAVDLVQLDVSVLDKDRHPVKGLTAADFVVLENGKQQHLVSFEEVNIPGVAEAAPRWVREAAVDVVDNDSRARRIVVIVFDDAHLEFDPMLMVQSQDIARRVVDAMGPNDLGAVTFTDEGRRQNITPDHERLRAAIASLTPHPNLLGSVSRPGPPPCSYRGKYRGDFACVFDTLVRAAEALKNAPPGRKTIVYIGTGVPFGFGATSDLYMTPNEETAIGVAAMLKALQEGNINIYAMSPGGVLAGIVGSKQDSLRLFAEETGGRATLGTNDPAQGVAQMFAENSSYYLLAIASAAPDKKDQFRKIEVRVTRPGLDVRTRSGYYVPRAGRAQDAKASTAATPLQTAINQAIPGGDMPLAISVSPFATPSRKEAALAITLVFREGMPPGQRVEVATMALDARCGDCKKLPQNRQTLTIAPPSGPGPATHSEVLSRLMLPPGGYEIRVAAATEGRSGGVFAHVDVPDFRKETFSASGVILSADPPLTAQRTLFADVIPLVPTAWREFSRDASVTAFQRFYQLGNKTPGPVRVTATIRDAADKVNLERTQLLESAAFTPSLSADYRLDLPLDTLGPGAHVLHLDAQAGGRTIKRDVRFTVR